jgi:hypothetical protein
MEGGGLNWLRIMSVFGFGISSAEPFSSVSRECVSYVGQ